MSKLRHALNQEIILRGYSENIRESYIYALEQLSNYVKQPIGHLTNQDLYQYFRHMTLEKKLSRSTVLLHLNAVKI